MFSHRIVFTSVPLSDTGKRLPTEKQVNRFFENSPHWEFMFMFFAFDVISRLFRKTRGYMCFNKLHQLTPLEIVAKRRIFF